MSCAFLNLSMKPVERNHWETRSEQQDLRNRGQAVLLRAADSSWSSLGCESHGREIITDKCPDSSYLPFQLSADNCWIHVTNHSTKMWSLKHKWPKPSRALDGLTFYCWLTFSMLWWCYYIKMPAFCSHLSHVFSHLCQTCLLCRPKHVFFFTLCCPFF